MTANVRAHGITDTGLVRTTNEDALAMAELSSGARWQGKPVAWSSEGAGVLLVVSDGMGGAKAGEVASALSIDGVLKGMLDAAKAGAVDEDVLRRVVESASENVWAAGQRRPDRKGMGATLTAIVVQGLTAFVAQIGDSRAYLLRGEKIGQLTHDQSYVQSMVDAGVMTPEEAERSPRKNIILQVMGQPEVRVVVGRVTLAKGDRLLVCSDGLTNVVDDETIHGLASAPVSLTDATVSLVKLVKEGGAPDNVTIIVAEIV